MIMGHRQRRARDPRHNAHGTYSVLDSAARLVNVDVRCASQLLGHLVRPVAAEYSVGVGIHEPCSTAVVFLLMGCATPTRPDTGRTRQHRLASRVHGVRNGSSSSHFVNLLHTTDT